MNNEQYIFFASCAKGLEKCLYSEITQKSDLFFDTAQVNITMMTGGVEIKTDLHTGCLLNEVLKIATRILLRIETFKVRDFPKLYNKAKKIQWNNYLRGQTPSIESSAFQSRVFDSRKIETTLLKAISEHYVAQAPKKKYLDNNQTLPPSSVYVRIDNDTCTLSMDLSGDRLDLRGYKLASSNAPIRESLAAAMIYQIQKYSKNSDTLLDLMCGSGSFSLESINFFKRNTERDYYYKWMPLFLKLPQKKKVSAEKEVFNQYIINDLDERTYMGAKENLSPFINSQNCLFTNLDILKLTNRDLASKNQTLILNPPYGKRIKTEIPIRDFFKNLITAIENNILPSLLGIIIPRELGNFKFKGKVIEKLEFDNGGYPVIFYITRYDHQE